MNFLYICGDVLGSADAFDAPLLLVQLFADALYKSAGGIRAVFSGAESGFAFAVCGEESELERFFGFFKAEFEVRGGGRNGIRQGTVNAAETAIKAYFENKALN